MQPAVLAACYRSLNPECVGEMPPDRCCLPKGFGVPDSRTAAEFPPS